ncbi:MAG TPA: PSD1 and planctomycete cytochrome C domain-containing protein [Planctomycetota bacterium]
MRTRNQDQDQASSPPRPPWGGPRGGRFSWSWSWFLVLSLSANAQDPEGAKFFEEKIRPVLVEKCYSCHSADAKKVKGDLLLDTREGTLKGGETGPAVVPGDLDKSLLIKAIRWTDDDLKMPPKNMLPKQVVADFEAWVKSGAHDPRTGAAKSTARVIDIDKGKEWWAFQPLKPVAGKDVDTFLRAKLAEKGLAPNPPADRRRLIRRAYLDLLGVPPTPAEVETKEPWPAILDRLLADPRYGERWARYWLDNTRFAESHGFEQDYDREGAYHFRDFVIRALNADMPWDRFVSWQVAGDELAPDEPLAWMATGFLGAGAFPTQLTEVEFEPARYDELDDMGSTVGSAMLGLSIGCARCHDHKYDPLPTVDYYRLISTFTGTIRSHAEFDFDREKNAAALAAWETARRPLAEAVQRYEREELPARFDARKPSAAPWTVLDVEATSKGGATFARQPDGSLLAGGKNPDHDLVTFKARVDLPVASIRVEALTDPSLKKGGPGRADNGNFALTDVRLSANGKRIPLAAPRATFEQTGLSIAASIDGDRASGWAVDPQFGKTHAAVFDLETPLAGAVELVVELEFNNNARHVIGRPRLSVSAARGADLRAEGMPQALVETSAPREKALAAFRALDPGWTSLKKALDVHDAKRPPANLTKVQVSTEGMKPLKHNADGRGYPHFYPETRVLARGDVNKKQGVATQSFPRVLMRGADESRWLKPPGPRTPNRRSALAAWLTDVDHGAGPLLARVAANRVWHHHFGRGIVATPNDFGVQGEAPSHPELLEWLAGELIRGGWRLKPLHKLLMSSAAYMESTSYDDAKAKIDPDNRLYWRRPLKRLDGEAIRDSMLSVSGLLDPAMYGPGTLNEGTNRRSVYFFVKRSQLIPMMQLFDAPEALVPIGARPTTTIAPQALLFMNSPHVRRYAQGLAKRMSPDDPVGSGFRLALGRDPSPQERETCAAYLKSGATTADFAQILFSMSEFIYVD